MKRISAILLFASTLCFVGSHLALADLRLHFINVGHGDAIWLEEDGVSIALVDAGKPEAGPVVLDYLRSLGVTQVEHLFVTHNHEDHVGGVPLILDSLAVGIIHHAGMVNDWPEAKMFEEYLETGRWLEDIVSAGDIPVQINDLTIEVLSPLKREAEDNNADPNLCSLVLLITHGQVKILLTADVYKDREHWLVKRYGKKLKCDAMKASHHASKKGNSAEFLEMVQPRIVVICVGPNDWGYPSEKTLRRLQEYCPRVLRTDLDGTVILKSDGRSLVVENP